jgi:hypothetical protein
LPWNTRGVGDRARLARQPERGVDRAHDRDAQRGRAAEPGVPRQRQARAHAERRALAARVAVAVEQRAERPAQHLGALVALRRVGVEADVPGRDLEPRARRGFGAGRGAARERGGEGGPAVHHAVLAEQDQLAVAVARRHPADSLTERAAVRARAARLLRSS